MLVVFAWISKEFGDAEVNQTTGQTRFERDTIEARGKKQIYWENVEGERTKDHYNRGPGERHEEGQQADDARKGIRDSRRWASTGSASRIDMRRHTSRRRLRQKTGSEQSVRTAQNKISSAKRKTPAWKAILPVASCATQGSPSHFRNAEGKFSAFLHANEGQQSGQQKGRGGVPK